MSIVDRVTGSLWLLGFGTALVGTGCIVEDGAGGCAVVDNEDGTYTMSCDDGTEVVFSDGEAGADGAAGEYGEDGTGGGGGSVGTMLMGSFTISNEVDVAFLASVEEITGTLTIDAAGLDELALPNLVAIGGDLIVQNNTFESLVMPSLQADDGVAGNIQITNNPNLEDLDGLSNLTRQVGNFTLDANIGLVNCSGLENLSEVTGHLSISNSPSVVNLSGLDNLTTVGDSMQLTSNEGLLSLEGLGALATVGGDFFLMTKPLLGSFGGAGVSRVRRRRTRRLSERCAYESGWLGTSPDRPVEVLDLR